MTPKNLMRLLRRLARGRGWEFVERKGKGSHVVVKLRGRRSTIPMHGTDIPTGTYRAILKDLDVSEDDLERF